MTNIPVYFDWTFWTAFLALLAIVLSQLPPIHFLLKRAKSEMELYSRIQVTQKVGHPNVQLHVILSNVGGKDIKYRSIIAAIKRDGRTVVELPSQTYLQTTADKTAVILAPFTLKPKEEWAHIINCFNPFTRDNEKQYKAAESKLKRDINEKLKNRKRQRETADSDDLVEADPTNVVFFENMFNRAFIWQPGEYQLQITTQTVPASAGTRKNFRFTLFESDSDEIKNAIEGYKHGEGLYFDTGKYPGVIVPIVEA